MLIGLTCPRRRFRPLFTRRRQTDSCRSGACGQEGSGGGGVLGSSPRLFTVGPVQLRSDILAIGSQQPPYFRTAEFSEMNGQICRSIKRLVHADDGSEVVLLTASGTGAMEAAVINAFSTNDKVLVVVGGTFGRRFEQICAIHGIEYTAIRLAYGEAIKRDVLDAYRSSGFTGMLINVHETSTGVCHDMSMVGEFCRQEGLVLVADAISSFLADPYYMSEWNIDVSILSSQKALAVPPGVSMLVISPPTVQRIRRNCVRSLYFDLKDYLEDIKRGQTPYTPAVGILVQMARALSVVEETGVDRIVADTERLATYFRKGIADLPFTIPSERLSNALTPLRPRNGISAYSVFLHLKDRYGIIVTPNGGDLRDELFRVGHIGNLCIDDMDALIDALHHMNREGMI